MPKKKIDPSLLEKCEFRYNDEMIGFEGILVSMCQHKKHPGIKNIYPRCIKKHCPLKA